MRSISSVGLREGFWWLGQRDWFVCMAASLNLAHLRDLREREQVHTSVSFHLFRQNPLYGSFIPNYVIPKNHHQFLSFTHKKHTKTQTLQEFPVFPPVKRPFLGFFWGVGSPTHRSTGRFLDVEGTKVAARSAPKRVFATKNQEDFFFWGGLMDINRFRYFVCLYIYIYIRIYIYIHIYIYHMSLHINVK